MFVFLKIDTMVDQVLSKVTIVGCDVSRGRCSRGGRRLGSGCSWSFSTPGTGLTQTHVVSEKTGRL